MMRYKSLDGLRGVAAYMVVLSHFLLANFKSPGLGQLGVMIFFTLSGFLMGRLYCAEAFTAKNVRDFFVKRVARVLPLYFLVVLGCFAWFFISGAPVRPIPIQPRNIVEHLFLIKGTGILWTIPVEIQFYLIFPLLWLAFSAIGSASIGVVNILIVASFLAAPLGGPVVIPLLPFFLAGVAVSMVSIQIKGASADAFFIASVVLLVLCMPQIARHIGINTLGYWKSPVFLVLIPTLLLASMNSPLADRLLGGSVLSGAGAISYSVYLLHPIVQWQIYSIPGLSISVRFVMLLAGTTILATTSYLLVERPCRKAITSLLVSKREEIAQPTERHLRDQLDKPVGV